MLIECLQFFTKQTLLGFTWVWIILLNLLKLDLEKLQKILESFKFESRALSLELEELNYLQIPCILHWDFDHFVVLTKVTNKYIYINDPAYGQK